jgi:K+-sensing histidine kinase KdpD
MRLRTPIATIIVAIDTLKENKTNYQKRIKLFYLVRIDITIRLNRQVEEFTKHESIRNWNA